MTLNTSSPVLAQQDAAASYASFFTARPDRTWLAVTLLSVLFLGGCGEASTSLSRGKAIQPISAHDFHVVGGLGKTRAGIYTARWTEQPIKVNAAGPLWEAAARRWQSAVHITHDKNGRIRFAGFTERPVCGYAVPYLRKGEITRCDIFLNKKLAEDVRICGGSEVVLAHEMGHCLGIIGHTRDGGLMDALGGNKQVSRASLEGLRGLYGNPVIRARKPGA